MTAARHAALIFAALVTTARDIAATAGRSSSLIPERPVFPIISEYFSPFAVSSAESCDV